jgi:di/tricarboxylate transporter
MMAVRETARNSCWLYARYSLVINVDIEYSDHYNDVCCWNFNPINDPAQTRKFGVALMLGIAYSASIGGIGTPPNTLLASFLSDNYGISIDFGTWMLMGVPLVIIMLPIAWE